MSSGLTPYNLQAVPMTQRSIAFGSIGAGYTIVGSIFSAPVIELIIVSTLDQHVQLSLDGVNDFIPMVAGGLLIPDIKTNQAVLPAWRAVYVKQLGVPTTGSLYVGGFTI